jgi:glycosyltransferase involved in cell wall biosynthesis
MKKLIPSFFKKPLIALYVLGRLILKGRRAKEIRINLAGVLPPPGKIVHGGKVKLLALREKFGDSWKHFNIAYFVSSGLPFAPTLWIKIYKLFGVKIIWNQNGVAYPALYSKEVVERVNGLLKPIHGSHYVVYQTEFTKRCSDRFLGIFRGPSTVLINPIDTTLFKPRETPLPQEPLIILMLGNHFESEERMTASLEALRKLRSEGVNLKLIIIGRTERKFKEDWIETRGSYLQSEAPALFQEAHLFLHLKYLDPCPTTVLEALASGMPIIGSRSGGMPEMVTDASGVLIPAVEDFEKLHYPSPDEVAEAIKQVVQNLAQYSAEARKQALKFDKENWLQKHETIFHQVLNHGQ